MARGQDSGANPNRQVGRPGLLQRLADRASVPTANALQRMQGKNSGVYVMNNYEARAEKKRVAEENQPPTPADYF